MIAVHVSIIMCSILEIVLTMASVRTAKAMAKEPQDTQVCEVTVCAVNKLDMDMTMIKELMIRKYYIPNSNASCSLSASVLKGVIKGTLCTRDVDNVIYQKIIQVVVISLFGKREIF